MLGTLFRFQRLKLWVAVLWKMVEANHRYRRHFRSRCKIFHHAPSLYRQWVNHMLDTLWFDEKLNAWILYFFVHFLSLFVNYPFTSISVFISKFLNNNFTVGTFFSVMPKCIFLKCLDLNNLNWFLVKVSSSSSWLVILAIFDCSHFFCDILNCF